MRDSLFLLGLLLDGVWKSPLILAMGLPEMHVMSALHLLLVEKPMVMWDGGDANMDLSWIFVRPFV